MTLALYHISTYCMNKKELDARIVEKRFPIPTSLTLSNNLVSVQDTAAAAGAPAALGFNSLICLITYAFSSLNCSSSAKKICINILCIISLGLN